MNITHIILEYDHERHILHLTASEVLQVTQPSDLDLLCLTIQTFLDENSGGRRSYMIVDLTRIVIDPSLAPVYASHLEQMIDKYVYGDGIARYGFGITRVTAQLGHESVSGRATGDDRNCAEEPDLFRTREEAQDHIQTLINRHQSVRSPHSN